LSFLFLQNLPGSQLKSADLAKEEMSKLKADNEKLLEAARLERDKILKEAIAAGNKLKDEAKEDSQRIGKKMIEDARVTIQNEKKTAMEDVKKQLSQFSMEIAEKILRRELENKKAQQKLVNEYIKDMKVN
jgi:F-type H+-transporting ATPase subunit b